MSKNNGKGKGIHYIILGKAKERKLFNYLYIFILF